MGTRFGPRSSVLHSDREPRRQEFVIEVVPHPVVRETVHDRQPAAVLVPRSRNVFRITSFPPTLAATYAFPFTANSRLAASGSLSLVLVDALPTEGPRRLNAIDYEKVEAAVRETGAVIHSVDSVSAGRKLVEPIQTPQD